MSIIGTPSEAASFGPNPIVINAVFCNAADPVAGLQPADGPTFLRILWMESGTDRVAVISVPSKMALPEWRTRGELVGALATGQLLPQDRDPFAPPALYEDEISESAKRIRDERWAVVRRIVLDSGCLIFSPDTRGALIAETAKATQRSKRCIYQWLRMYWQGGQTLDALRPHFDRCGNPGKERGAGAAKRGRPSRLGRLDPERVGVNVTREVRDKIIAGARRFVERERLSIAAAYRRTLDWKFALYHDWRDGVLVPVPAPAHQLPTERQFRYVYEKEAKGARAVKAKMGERRFNLRHRPALGTSADLAFGPGSLYQVDATVGDLYLLSNAATGRVIGRPVIYIVMDAYSRVIVGFHVGLYGPSWLGLAMALENACTPKDEFCRRLGKEVGLSDWPCHHLPEAVLGDRGELLSKHADHFCSAHTVRIANTASWRADWKGIVERNFRTLNDAVIKWQPGHVHDLRERGDPDYRLDATLTLRDFQRMLLLLVLHHNHNHVLSGDAVPLGYPYPAEEDPTPMDVWRWGIEHRTGHLRVADRERIRGSLLPGAEVSVTGRGLRFRGLHYAPVELLRGSDSDSDPGESAFEGWFLRNTGRGTKRVPIAYDPRDARWIYLRLEGGKQLVTCGLLRGDRRYAGLSFDEIEDARAVGSIRNQLCRTERLQSEAGFHAEISAIKREAEQRRAEVLGVGTKGADLEDIRGARAAERRAVDQNEAWRPADMAARESPSSDGTGTDSESYLPPPTELSTLAAARARRRKGADGA